ncbi:hypothetical protein VZT92_003572 [Zoarces viviparus]|uniref:Uncharacterized protein n=1 Tax=Zoarces viviparus TaxID=48416 RepID=A0AAW1FUK3_ZOAVI
MFRDKINRPSPQNNRRPLASAGAGQQQPEGQRLGVLPQPDFPLKDSGLSTGTKGGVVAVRPRGGWEAAGEDIRMMSSSEKLRRRSRVFVLSSFVILSLIFNNYS